VKVHPAAAVTPVGGGSASLIQVRSALIRGIEAISSCV
jgi:hypothetical protein